MVHSEEQNKCLETNLKETQALELLGKDFKTTNLKILNKLKGKHRPRPIGKPRKQNKNKMRISTKTQTL